MRIAAALQGVARLGLDTSPFIYYVENVSGFYPRCAPFFAAIAAGSVEAFTGTITLTEALSHPLQQGDMARVTAFRTLLRATQGIRLLELSSDLAERAADLRSRYNLRAPDAVQVATALEASCDAFLTNDPGLKRVVEIPVLVVSELTP